MQVGKVRYLVYRFGLHLFSSANCMSRTLQDILANLLWI